MNSKLSDPAWWADLAAEVAEAVYGPLERPLADLVKETSRVYTRERDALQSLVGKTGALQARMRFFLPRDVFKTAGPLGELEFAGALPHAKTWRVLDLGAGLGTTSLGALAMASRHDRALNVTALDVDAAALRGFRALADHVGMQVKTHVSDLTRDALPDGRFDLIFCGLFLNELPASARARLLAQLHERLADDGSLILIEPALHEPTRALQRLGDEARAGKQFTVFAPCLRRGPCPMLLGERDWCHEDRPFRLPPSLVPVAKDAGLRFERVTYAYLTLRRDGRRLADALEEGASRVVSQVLVSKGKRELYVCGEMGHQKLVRLDRRKTDANTAFDDTVRGDALWVGDTVTKGDGERIEAETSVARISPGSRTERPSTKPD